MKAANPQLIALLDSGNDFEMADLWTITLAGGTVARWSGADVPVMANGQIFGLGPAITRGAISEKIGLEVSTLAMTITADANDLVNGTPLIPFIRKRGFDGAVVRLDRAFLPDWVSGATGTVLRFAGKVTSIDAIKGSSCQLTLSAWTVLLNVNMPTNLDQAGCLHSVYDAGCGLSPASFAAMGYVSGSPTTSGFASSLSTTASDFAQGRVLFTSGPNTGVAATVRDNDGAGNFTLIRPLPAAPVAGDAFTAYPGCDLTQGRCGGRFNNLPRFKGTPFVPVPETAVGT